MGSLHAREMAGMLSLEDGLAWHLQSNHYPPIPLSMVEPCKEAIDAYWEDDLDREIQMPKGVFYRGETTAPARAIIVQHHLDAWCEEEPFEDEID